MKLLVAVQNSFRTAGVVFPLPVLPLVAVSGREAIYYSAGIPVQTELSNNDDPTGKIQLSVTNPTVGANITATVTLPSAGTARLRY